MFLNKSKLLKSVLEPLCSVMHLGKCIMGNTDTYALAIASFGVLIPHNALPRMHSLLYKTMLRISLCKWQVPYTV